MTCFLATAFDKSAAVAGRWRISESTLLFLGIVGGSLYSMRASVIFPSFLFLSSLAFAAPDNGAFACKPAGNQQEMNECAVNAFRASDAQLSIQYQQVMASLNPVERVTLRQEQHAWLKQRDPQCKARTKESEGGSIWPLEYYSCLETANKKRTLEFTSRAIKK